MVDGVIHELKSLATESERHEDIKKRQLKMALFLLILRFQCTDIGTDKFKLINKKLLSSDEYSNGNNTIKLCVK